MTFETGKVVIRRILKQCSTQINNINEKYISPILKICVRRLDKYKNTQISHISTNTFPIIYLHN